MHGLNLGSMWCSQIKKLCSCKSTPCNLVSRVHACEEKYLYLWIKEKRELPIKWFPWWRSCCLLQRHTLGVGTLSAAFSPCVFSAPQLYSHSQFQSLCYTQTVSGSGIHINPQTREKTETAVSIPLCNSLCQKMNSVTTVPVKDAPLSGKVKLFVEEICGLENYTVGICCSVSV